MAKITSSGPSFSDNELSDPDLPRTVQQNLPSNRDRPVTRFMFGISDAEGGEELSAGNNSSQSSRDEFNSNSQQTVNRQKPVPDVENPSVHSGQESSDDALLTDGNIPEMEMASDDEVPPYSEWSYRELQAECKVRELVATGTHDELVDRLEKFDERHADN